MKYIFLLAAFLLSACGAASNTPQPTQIEPAQIEPAQIEPTQIDTTSSTHAVRYHVESTGGTIDLTYSNASGATEQASTSAGNPPGGSDGWNQSFNAPSGQLLYVSSQNNTATQSSCEISIDGKVVSSAIANGNYKVALCSASVP